MQYGNRPLYHPENVYVIGDVHNKGHKLRSLVDQITPIMTDKDHLVFAGDLNDRGEDFPVVIEVTSELLLKYPNQVYFVAGNHESMIINWYLNGKLDWMKYIESTLEQVKVAYGLNDIKPATIKEWLANNPNIFLNHLIPYYETPEVIVTHAGLDKEMCYLFGLRSRPEGILDRLKELIQWQFIDEQEKIPEITKFMICGHQYAHHTSPRIFKDRCFIDTGCGRSETAPCTAIKYPGKKIWQSA